MTEQTDWYQRMFGRPSPGRRAPTRASRYLDDPASEPRANAPERGIFIEPRGLPNTGGPVVPDWARARRRGERVPLSQLTGRDRRGPVEREPYGDNFAAWVDEGRMRPDFPDELLERPAPDGDGPANPGNVPRNPNNVIADATEALTPEYLATRRQPYAEARYRSRALPNGSHLRTSEPEFDRVQEAPPEAFQPVAPEISDVNRDWIAAEERSAERWRRGAPSPTDMFFAVVFGNRSAARQQVVADETAEALDEVTGRRPARPANPRN